MAAYTGAIAQGSPEFSFQLLVEDSQGNRDSVILGYDQAASPLIDGVFEESDISSDPFDEVLELRTSFSGNVQSLQSKTQITSWSCNSGLDFISIAINIHAIHYPLRLSWDPTQFNSATFPCHDASVLVEDAAYFNFPLSSFNPVFLKDFPEKELQEGFGTTTYQTDLTSGMNGEIRVLYFAFSDIPLSGTSLDRVDDPHIKLFNSLNELTIITESIPEKWLGFGLWNIHGQKQAVSMYLGEGRYDISTVNLSSGVYLVKGQTCDGRIFLRKWIKE